MADTNWKKWEREVCAYLGGGRTGPRGYNLPDCVGTGFSVECKYTKKLALRGDWLEQAVENQRPMEPWLLAIKEAGTGRRIVVMDFFDFLQVISER